MDLQQQVSGYAENLVRLFFFMDFFFKVFIICDRLKQSEGQIPLCLTSERRFDNEKNSIFTHCLGFSRWLFCRMVRARYHL
jgi:hypothetical protein